MGERREGERCVGRRRVSPWRRGALAVVAVLSSCGVAVAACSGSDSGTGSGDGEVATPSGVSYLEDASDVPGLIYDQFGEIVSFTRLNLSDDEVMIELRDPDVPENLDLWRYREGEWSSTPVSVTLAQIEQLDQTTFGPDAIAWDRIPGLIQEAYDGLALEEEEITSVSYDRIAGQAPRVYIGVTGLRGSGRLLANADGTEVEVERS